MKDLIKNECLAIIVKGVSCPTLKVAIDTFDDAKSEVENYIQLHNLGGSTFKGAIIFHPVKGGFAHVSYNGRIWKGIDQFNVYAKKEEILTLNANNC